MQDVPDPGRRRVVTSLALGGAAVVGGVAGAGAVGAAQSGGGFRRETLSLDVACLGHTWRDVVPRNPANDADFRFPFMVEGWIYKAGTIPGDGFVPTATDAIGTWICRGWVLIDGSRPEPHVASVHEYLLGTISEEQLFPSDTLSSTGLEGTITQQTAFRPVIGGTGQYMGATGQVSQRINGVNTTVLDDGSGDPAPNFAFTYDLLIPDL